MKTETTERDLVTVVEDLLNDVGFRGDFETVSRPLLRRLVEEVKDLRAANISKLLSEIKDRLTPEEGEQFVRNKGLG